MSVSSRKVLRVVLVVVFFAVAGTGLFFVFTGYVPPFLYPKELREQQKFLKEWENKYKSDTYGGSTPEETLQLFIDALKRGDVDLAAKYFVVDEQEKIKGGLSEAKRDGKLGEVVGRMQLLRVTKRESDSAFFVVTNNGMIQYQALLRKNENGRWKILDL